MIQITTGLDEFSHDVYIAVDLYCDKMVKFQWELMTDGEVNSSHEKSSTIGVSCIAMDNFSNSYCQV